MNKDKIVIYSRQFNQLVKIGAIESDYLINCDISQEKDDLMKRIEELEQVIIAFIKEKNDLILRNIKLEKLMKSYCYCSNLDSSSKGPCIFCDDMEALNEEVKE